MVTAIGIYYGYNILAVIVRKLNQVKLCHILQCIKDKPLMGSRFNQMNAGKSIRIICPRGLILFMFRINHATMHLPGTVFPILHKVISYSGDAATAGTGIDINLDIFPVSSVRPVIINKQVFDHFNLLIHW